MINYLLCKFGIHKWKDVRTQISKGICYGFGPGSPGYRVIQKCMRCGKLRHMKLNLLQPDEDLYKENIWRQKNRINDKS